MAEITKEIPTALYQRSGEKLFKLLLETVAKQVILEDGTTVQETLETIQNVLSQNTTTYVVEDIAAMEALEGVIVGDSCWVIDASADETVESGAAKYIYQSEDAGWVKVSEAESMDVVVNWDDVQEKPDVLDRLGVDEDGNLTLDGEEVGSGESESKPWTAYGDGVDAAPAGLRDAGVYVSGEGEAPEEAQSAVLRQKREEDLVPIYPRTSAELVSVAIEGLEATDAAGAISEVLDVANAASSDAATAQSAAEAAQATADEALTKAEAGGGEAGEVAVEVEELKQQVEALQAALDAIDLSVYMKKANDQFTAGYYGTVVNCADVSPTPAIYTSSGSVFIWDADEIPSYVPCYISSEEMAGAAGCITVIFPHGISTEKPYIGGPDFSTASIVWPDGEHPDLTDGACHVLTFITTDGKTWYGVENGADYGADGSAVND